MVEIHPKNKKPLKAIEIVLTLFYGQFVANAIYDNFIRGIPDLVREQTYYNIIKVTLGLIMIALAIYSMIVIWLKKYHVLIFVSAILLTIVFLVALVVSIIDIVQRKERNVTTSQEVPILAAILTVESIFRIGAIILTFVMVKILRSNYELVESK